MNTGSMQSFGPEIVDRIDQLAQISGSSEHLSRIFLTPEHRTAATLILSWMRQAGMQAHLDAIGNVCGRYEGEMPDRRCLMLGPHYDTVHNAGKWDRLLGLVTAISCVRELNRRQRRLPFAVEVVGFADEEGVRFASALIGSRAVAGGLEESLLASTDRDGTSIRDALLQFGLDPAKIGSADRRRSELYAYIELHIEQGPVLEAQGLPVGVVTAISGATRLSVVLLGMAGHSGTVPMMLRRDALAGAAECIVAIEEYCRARPNLVGTVGRLDVTPGATNVIPGQTTFTVDIRTASNADRNLAVNEIVQNVSAIASRRNLVSRIQFSHDNSTAPCAPWVQRQIAAAIAAEGHRVLRLASGAGHDGMAMIEIADIGMVFVRCRGGISHHPDEHVDLADADAGARVLMRVIDNFRPAQFEDGSGTPVDTNGG
jgi:allantoate deiminase